MRETDYLNRILITGASGFIGAALLDAMKKKCFVVRGAVRRLDSGKRNDNSLVEIGDLEISGSWGVALKDVKCVIHLAARAHQITKNEKQKIEAFRKVNVIETIRLAEQAAKTGVNRFIYISSIGVNGNSNIKPYTENDTPKPNEPYAISKYEAEQALTEISINTGMELVIIRPPLVYGPGVPGNFRRLMNLVSLGLPLPLGSIHNKRSFLALDNLIDFIIACVNHPKAANQLFLLCDNDDLSTTQLVKYLIVALGKSTKILPFPEKVLEWGLSILGRRDVARQLFGSLQIDNCKARTLLDWSPPVSVVEELRKTADTYLQKLS